jgi:putative ABC transport system permease protein
VSGWRTALRIAWREARRARARALMVIAMIALPVAALALGAVTWDTFRLTTDERAERLMGTAQAVVSWPRPEPVQQLPDRFDVLAVLPDDEPATPPVEPTTEHLLELLPAGTTAIADRTVQLDLRTATGTAPITTRLLDYADPLARGRLRQLSGRAPASNDEVVLTPAATRRLDAVEGGAVRLTGGRELRVVGVVEDPTDLDATAIVVRPDALGPSELPAGGANEQRRQTKWLVATPGPLTWEQVKALNTHGVTAVSRHVLANPPSSAQQYPNLQIGGPGEDVGIAVLVGGLAMLEIVLLAGPAFAVGARRRRRDLALVAAAGGTPAHTRRIVLADGVVLGAFAAGAGLVFGVLAAAVCRPLFEEQVGHVRSGEFRVFPLALAAIAGLAVATGVLAALVPAWISSRQDVVSALAGRRGITRSRRRWVMIGGTLAGAGAVVAAVGALRIQPTLILAGLVVGELGLVLCTPAIVGLVARAGRLLPLAPRIALRDTSRNRTAAAPAISAVMAAVVGTLAIGMVNNATTARDELDYRTLAEPGDVSVVADIGKQARGDTSTVTSPRVLAALRDTMPVDQVHQVSRASCETGCFVEVVVPPERACPYLPEDDPTPDQQRAARRDDRCADAGIRYNYFGGFGSRSGLVLVIDEAALGPVAKVPAEDLDEVAAALRSGAVVVSSDRDVVDGRITLALRTGPGQSRQITAAGFVLPNPPRAPLALMSAQTATALGLVASPLAVVATTTRMPTVEEEDRLRAALGTSAFGTVERGPYSEQLVLVVLAIVAAVITFAASAVATGLAAADGRSDLGTLAAVGASPGVRRALSLSQSAVIAGLGSVLGAATGLGASIAVLSALNRGYAQVWPAPAPYPIEVPWFNVAIAVVVVPLIATLGAGLLTRSRLPIERRL